MIKVYLAVGALVLGLLLKCDYDGDRRREGAAAVRDSIAAHRIDSLIALRSRVDTVYNADTVVRWRSIRETVRLLDTLLLSDTVVLTKRESVLVFAADTAIKACRSIVSACEQRLVIRDSLLAAMTADRNTWRSRSMPSLKSQALTTVRTIGVWELLMYAIKEIK